MYWMDYRIEVGEAAPDFRLESTTGRSVRLYDCKNKRTAVLFFFNHDSDACLSRLKALAADHGRFKEEGAAILPITIIRKDDGKALADRLGLNILCDADHSVSKAYNVSRCSDPAHVCFNVIEKVQSPTVLIVDTSGIIRYKRAADASGKPDNATLLDECRNAMK